MSISETSANSTPPKASAKLDANKDILIKNLASALEVKNEEIGTLNSQLKSSREEIVEYERVIARLVNENGELDSVRNDIKAVKRRSYDMARELIATGKLTVFAPYYEELRREFDPTIKAAESIIETAAGVPENAAEIVEPVSPSVAMPVSNPMTGIVTAPVSAPQDVITGPSLSENPFLTGSDFSQVTPAPADNPFVVKDSAREMQQEGFAPKVDSASMPFGTPVKERPVPTWSVKGAKHAEPSNENPFMNTDSGYTDYPAQDTVIENEPKKKKFGFFGKKNSSNGNVEGSELAVGNNGGFSMPPQKGNVGKVLKIICLVLGMAILAAVAVVVIFALTNDISLEQSINYLVSMF